MEKAIKSIFYLYPYLSLSSAIVAILDLCFEVVLLPLYHLLVLDSSSFKILGESLVKIIYLTILTASFWYQSIPILKDDG